MNIRSVLIALLMLMFCSACVKDNDLSKIRTEVERHLIKGMQIDQAKKVLADYDFEYSWVENEHTIYAKKMAAKNASTVKEGLTLVIRFDQKSELVGFDAKQVFTGP